ncbi:MAG: Acyl-coenzyme A:6-aminopenicillanic acid acyl-transferase [Firmicutes bacterium ADurb.Bin248]|nr:MAG: Acyl-coenzyme A:6-aminopenicillanic acid acyl-transferase [Firmicutes bacterium ADurb.Bin248]
MSPQSDAANARVSERTFPFYTFRGSHREIGRQYGEACRTLIEEHLDCVNAKLLSKPWISKEKVDRLALEFRGYVREYAAFFDEEVEGLAEGAGIGLSEAYALQLRAELHRQLETGDECTTYAVHASRTADGVALIGQDADLPAFYANIGVVTRIMPEGGPSILQFTPAGQVSYIGINDRGVGVFGNFLTCGGWRIGFPRYLLSRLALTHERVADALTHLSRVRRASSRNLIMTDAAGDIADMETTAGRHAVLRAEDGILCHSNHYLSPELMEYEAHGGEGLANSRARYARMRELLHENAGGLDAGRMQAILRDRQGPYPICRMPGDEESDTITAASVIARPALGQIMVAVGPPNQYEYKTYAFGA